MPEPVKTRPYRSPKRRERAAETRRAVLRAARQLFTSQGFARTTVAAVATRAGVSVDTVYASVGKKPEVLLAVVDMSLAGSDEPLPAEDRGYVRAIRAASSAEEKIRLYAAALGEVMPRTAPLLEALEHAARTDEACAVAWRRLNERRAANMRLFAADLRSTGALRGDLTDGEVADIVWSTNAAQFYALVTSRGWSSERYTRLLEEMWIRLLLS